MTHVGFQKDAFAIFRTNDRAGPVQMLNLIRLNDEALFPDGSRTTGAKAYAAYGEKSRPVLDRVGGKILWRGSFEQTVIGPSSEAWDICFIAEYPSVQAFIDMVKDPMYLSAALARQAAVADSRLIRLASDVPGARFDG